MADTPTALEPGDGQADEDDDAAGEEVGGGGDDDDDAEEAAAAALPWDESESEAEAEAEEVDEQPPAKRQKSLVDGSLRSFVTKHAPPPAKIAASRKSNAYTPKKPIAEQPARQVGRGASLHKNGARVNDVRHPLGPLEVRAHEARASARAPNPESCVSRSTGVRVSILPYFGQYLESYESILSVMP